MTESNSPLTKLGQGAILASELARQGVDLRLTRRREGGEACAIALEECLRRRVAIMARRLRLKPWDQRGHLALNLAIDHGELALNLPPRLLRTIELPFAVPESGPHDIARRGGIAKEDAPS